MNRSFALAVLFGINLLNFYDRHIPGALAEPIRREFSLTDAQLGLINSMFLWVYAIIGIPLGRAADVWSRKKLLAGGTVIWSVMTAAAGFAASFTTLLIPRMGVGIGEAVCAPTASSWIGDLFPPNKRAKALAFFMLGFPIGGALSFFFAGMMADAWGWRTAMITAAAPALLLVPALLALREPERGSTEAQGGAKSGSMFAVLRIPTMWWIIASGALLNFIMFAIATFLPAMLQRIHHVTTASAGFGVGLTYLIGGSAGGALAGWLGDRVHGRENGRMLAAAALALVAVPFAYFGIVQQEGAMVLSVAMLTVTFGVLNGYYGLVYAAIQDIVQPAQRASTMAIYFFGMYMSGASLGPVLTGRLSDMLARRAAAAAGSADATADVFRATGLQQAMLVIPVLAIVLAVVLWAGSRTIGKDMAKLRTAR